MSIDDEAQRALAEAQRANKMGKFDAAVDAYEVAIRLGHQDESPRAMLELGQLYLQAGDQAMAELWFKQVALTNHQVHGPIGQKLLDGMTGMSTPSASVSTGSGRTASDSGGSSASKRRRKTAKGKSRPGTAEWFSRNPTGQNIEDLLAAHLDQETSDFRFANQKESDLAVKMMRGFLMMSLADEPVVAKRVMSLLGRLHEQREETDEAERKYKQAFANGVDEAALKAGALIQRIRGQLAARDFYKEAASQASSPESKSQLQNLQSRLDEVLKS